MGLEDIAPLPHDERPWRWYTFVTMWLAIAATPSIYSIAGSLLDFGLSPLEGLVAVAIASTIAAVATALNSAAGVTYGIPFPVYARASFGIEGAKYAALSRGAVGVMWLSFQLWISTDALLRGFERGASAMWLQTWAPIWSPYLNGGQLLAFIVVALLHLACIAVGVKHFDRLTYFLAPIGIALFGLIALWATVPSWGGASLTEDLRGHADGVREGSSDGVWIAGIAGVNSLVSMYSTLMLNMADLARLVPTQKDQVLGMMLGIPLPCVLAVGVGILGSAAIEVKSGKPSWLMPDLFQYWPAWACVISGLAMFGVNLVVNISANIIPPANDFMNICPHRLRWRWCAYGTVILACCACPFYLFHSAEGFAVRFLGGYGMVTGAIYGVMVSDYYIVRGRQLSLMDLYPDKPGEGAFLYRRGHNWRAVVATLAGIALPLPAWIGDLTGAEALPAFFTICGKASWFVACAFAALVYLTACWASPPPLSTATTKQAIGSNLSGTSTSASDLGSCQDVDSNSCDREG